MIQRITDYRVVRAEQSLEKTTIGIKTGGIQDRIFSAEKGADSVLQLLMDGLGAANKAYRCHTVAELVERFVRSRDDFRMIGQPKIVVRAEVQDFYGISIGADANGRLLWPGDLSFGLVKAFTFEGFGLRCE